MDGPKPEETPHTLCTHHEACLTLSISCEQGLSTLSGRKQFLTRTLQSGSHVWVFHVTYKACAQFLSSGTAPQISLGLEYHLEEVISTFGGVEHLLPVSSTLYHGLL